MIVRLWVLVLLKGALLAYKPVTDTVQISGTVLVVSDAGTWNYNVRVPPVPESDGLMAAVETGEPPAGVMANCAVWTVVPAV